MSNFHDSSMTEDGKALEVFQKYIRNNEATVLDVGCGSGSFLRALKDNRFTSLYGVDVENNISEMPFPEDRFGSVDLSYGRTQHPNDFFDAVTSWQVVEHLENPHNFIREAHRILKPGGYFFVSIPNPFHLMSRLLFLKNGNMPRWTRKNNHYTLFTKDLFWKAFLKDYFNLEETQYYKGEFTYSLFKHFDGKYPENELFGHFIIWVMRKKVSKNREM